MCNPFNEIKLASQIYIHSRATKKTKPSSVAFSLSTMPYQIQIFHALAAIIRRYIIFFSLLLLWVAECSSCIQMYLCAHARMYRYIKSLRNWCGNTPILSSTNSEFRFAFIAVHHRYRYRCCVSHPKLIFWLLLFYCIVYDNIYMRNFAPLHALSLFLAGVPHKDDEMSLMMLPMMKWWRMNECIIIYFYIYIYFYCVQIRCRRSMARLYKPSIAMRQWTNRKSNINTTSTGGRR